MYPLNFIIISMFWRASGATQRWNRKKQLTYSPDWVNLSKNAPTTSKGVGRDYHAALSLAGGWYRNSIPDDNLLGRKVVAFANTGKSDPAVRDMTRATHETDDHLIDLIYASLLGEMSWQQFLDDLGKTLPDGKSMMFFHDAYKSKGTFTLSSGLDEQAVLSYNQHYSRVNPWMRKAAVRTVGVGVIADEMLPHRQLERTEFYSDFLRRVNCHSAVGVTILRDEGRSFLLSTITSEKDPDCNIASAERLTRLAPHLKRAFRHYQNGPFKKAIAEIGGSLFDTIEVGLVIAGDRSHVKAMSATGETIGATGSCFRIMPKNRIRLCSQEADAMLKTMLERTYSGAKVINFLIDNVRVTLIQVQKDRFSFFFEGPTVVILLEPLKATAVNVNLIDFSTIHALTRAETRVLAGIVSGRNINRIAQEFGVSRETIRTQLKSLYAKTNTSGQIELIRMAAGLQVFPERVR